ncbi:MAG TPA: hypothetical protein VHP34_11450 [Alphaproteobacteria bacterium]|nr:hypothetical protein [Alphaproteobacteria bacterium]
MKIEPEEIEREIINLRSGSKKDKRIAVMLAWMLEQIQPKPSEFDRLMQ